MPSIIEIPVGDLEFPPSIPKSSFMSGIWEKFYQRLSSDVTSVTLADSSTPTIQTYTSAFPDKPVDQSDADTTTSASSYPILVLNSPDFSYETQTFGKKRVEGTIEIEIFTTKSESTDKFMEAIIYSIETYRDTLAGQGIKMVKLESTGKEEFFRGRIKVHVKSCIFSFIYYFDSTQTF